MKSLILAIFFCLFAQVSIAQDTLQSTLDSPFVLGRIIKIQSKILSEKRVLNIYLPEGYNQNDTIKYPVIYLLDGSADEDFIHIAGLVQYLNFSWVNILPKSIVVGIANVDRMRDFTFPTTIEKDKRDYPTSGGSQKFMAFIEKELQPFIERKYKTNSSKTIIGQSLGGLLATEILYKVPELFTNYIIISPSLWWNNETLLAAKPAIQKQEFTQPTFIYIAVGNEEEVMENDARKLVTILRKNQQKKLHIDFQYFAHENHATILYRAVYSAFESFNKSKKVKE